MTDRTTKLLLLAIALGLWANALIPLHNAPPVKADDSSKLSDIASHLSDIRDDVHKIARGSCSNNKIC